MAGGAFGCVELVAGAGAVEFFDVDVAERHGSAKLLCAEADLSEVLDCLGLHEGVGE